jgi:hypothetical protein
MRKFKLAPTLKFRGVLGRFAAAGVGFYASARPLQADGHQPESPSMISQPPFLLQLLSQLNADLLLQFN